jgi:beta-galactosidase
VAEFAWSLMEPEEGTFTWDFWDRVMERAHAHGLKVILGTPTATPPAWLTHKYPEVLNRTQAGVTYQHGQRRHYNYNAPVYRELVRAHRGRDGRALRRAPRPARLAD